ncbi:MAG: undecaprenyl diphosphate synthase family protein, partial [Candidatus Zipacnadales bacterium]
MTKSEGQTFPHMTIMPRHIAVVMDGNGRWARQRGLPRIEGHYQGRIATRRLVEECAKLHLEFLTVYAFSTENWTRAEEEVQGLLLLIQSDLAEDLEDLHLNNIRFLS